MKWYNQFLQLKGHYKELNPHHETWKLWTKPHKTRQEIFEVTIGTILVQNTSWVNVDKAIHNLRDADIFSFEAIRDCGEETLIELIRPAGFFNQKQKYLKSISNLFLEKEWNSISRKALLATKGIGRETADSILTYCLSKKYAIVGTYTKRFFAKFLGEKNYLKMKYELIQDEIQRDFQDSENISYELGLFHALVVVHSQNICTKRSPKCLDCLFKSQCVYNNSIDLQKELNGYINGEKKKKTKPSIN